MALTRSFLRGMQLSDEQIGAIIEAHADTVNALKDERDAEKDKASKIAEELDALKEKGGEWQERYEKEHSDFESYKKEQSEKANKDAIKDAYRNLLKECGVSEKRIASVMKVSDLSDVSLDKEGKLKNVDKLTESIKADWSDFITSTKTEGAKVDTPPTNSGSRVVMSKEQIMAIKDSAQRQRAIAENPEVFGI